MDNSLGCRIRSLRKAMVLTQEQLAQKAELSVSAIKSYENGWRQPNSKAMAALERIFQVSGSYLRGETEVREVEPIVKDAMSLEIVREKLPKKLQELSALLENGKDAEVEVAHHVVAELTHVLKMENPVQRNAALSILQDMVATTVFFLDTCENCQRDTDPAGRVNHAKSVVKTQMVQALTKVDIFLAK